MIKYPVIAILERDKNIYCYIKQEPFLIDSLHIFNDSVFFDSDLKKHYIKNAEKVSWANFFGYHPLFKGRSVNVKFNIEKSLSVSLSEVKSTLIGKLDGGAEKGFWYSRKDIPLLRDEIQKATNFNRLVKVFSEDI